jgi:hypothetical protein
MRLIIPLLLAGLLVLPACAPMGPTAPTAQSDVVVDGVSLLGRWDIIGAPDQPDVDTDIRSGQFTQMLVFNPYGRVTLTGEDRRAGTGVVAYEGRISGRNLTLEGRPGTATITVRSQTRLEMTDPRGNRTVYRRR